MRKVRSFDELFPNRFIQSSSFGDKIVKLTIKEVGVDEIQDGDNSENIAIIQFRETDKELSLNKTNAQLIAGMFGTNIDTWIGKQIYLHAIPFSNPMFPGVKTATRVYGSPEIEKDVKIQVVLPKKKPMQFIMKKEK